MKKRLLGKIEVSAIGMGCMGFTHAYGNQPEEKEGIRIVHQAFELGCNFFDTAEMYSYLKNEEFVGKAIKGLPRDKIVISDKFWPTALPGQEKYGRKLSEKALTQALDDSLKRLGTDYIDIYTEHQMETGSEEEVAYIMGKFIKAGKIRGWGQSSPTAEQIKKAHAVTPLTAIQSEYSLMERKWKKDVLPLCQELGIGYVAFAPMGNGFLSGTVKAGQQYEAHDIRTVITRFNDKNIQANQPLIDMLKEVAGAKGATPAQISLAWCLKSYEHLVPIPGMRHENRLRENIAAANVELSDDEFSKINKLLDAIVIHGSRDGNDIKRLGTVPQNVVR